MPAYAFVNYPTDGKVAAPGEVMPRTWYAPGAGYVGFRNGFRDENDTIVEFIARRQDTGRDNAGTFRITAFGEAWTHEWRPSSPERFTENVVQLPGQPVNEEGRGRIAFLERQPDGSGSVTIDLSEIYGYTSKGDTLEKYGNVLRRGVVEPTGRSGLRAAAVDYSGASGAPVLVAIADVIKGAGMRDWTWQLESGQGPAERGERLPVDQRQFTHFRWRNKDYPPEQHALLTEFEKIESDPQVKLLDNGFTITKGTAILRATISSQEPVSLRFGKKLEWFTGAKGSVLSNMSKAVFVESKGDFLVVVTIGKGTPPAVTFSGNGPAATATVGGQTISFNGETLRVGARK